MQRIGNGLSRITTRRWLWAGSIGLAIGGTALAGDYPARQTEGTRSDEFFKEIHQLAQFEPEQTPEAEQAPEPAQTQESEQQFQSQTATEPPVLTSNTMMTANPSGGSAESAESAEPWTLSGALFESEEPPVTIGGWLQAGYHNKSNGLFNSHPDQFASHQNYLYMERVADGSEGLGFGFRGDILYGADAQDTQAFGDPQAPDDGHWDNSWDNGIYGWALPQLYGEAAYGDLSVKVGHFYTLIGYEVVTAPQNFFYSHSFTMYNSEPFTHTGALGTYKAGDNATVYGGWVAGWDTGFDAQADLDGSRGSAFIGGTALNLTDTLTLTYILLAGDMGIRGEGYNHSIVADWQITEKLNYIAQSDLVELNNSSFGPNHTVGFNNFLIYSVNDKLGVGGRAEWWKPNGHSVYQITGGLNIKPVANLVIRPEIRYQWGADQVLESLAGFNGQPGVSDSAIFGIDAILTF